MSLYVCSCHSYLFECHFIKLLPTASCNHGTVRLVGGRYSYRGRVEICINGVWGTVCDNSWDYSDAYVVCRQLGFPSGMNIALGKSCCFPSTFIVKFFYLATSALRGYQHSFGQGSGPIFLDYVSCSWSAASLLSCSHNGFGVTSCSHSNDAGVVCSTCKLYALYVYVIAWFAVVFGLIARVKQEIK